MYDQLALSLNGRGTVHVVGTCHLSPSSPVTVQRAIAQHQPVAVLVELCEEREAVLDLPSRPTPLPALTFAHAKENWRVLTDPLFWLKLPFLGAEALVGTTEGMEFTAAAAAADASGAQLMLIDRPVSATLSRILVALPQLKLREWWRLLTSGSGEGSSAADIKEVRVAGRSAEQCQAYLKVLCEWQIMTLLGTKGAEGMAEHELDHARLLARRVVDSLDPNQDHIDIPSAIHAPLVSESDQIMGHAIFHVAQHLQVSKRRTDDPLERSP